MRSWHRTYAFPAMITNCSNNYGPYQFPEKLVPLMILNALEGKALPVYGKGMHVRDWLYVEDHVRALALVLDKGTVGRTYNISAHHERCNLDVVRSICRILDNLLPESAHVPHEHLINFVEDRPGHDFRYALDAARISQELGWKPRETFETGLEKTVQWYLGNLNWII